MKQTYKILDNIEKLAKEKGLTLEQVSVMADVKKERILDMNETFPSVDKLQRIGAVLGKSVYFLVHGEELPENTIVMTTDDGIKVLTGEKAKKFLKIFEELSSKDNQEED